LRFEDEMILSSLKCSRFLRSRQMSATLENGDPFPAVMGLSSCLSSTLDGGVLLDIEVQPGSSAQGITGINAWRSRLSVAVKAEARQGQANQAALHVLAAHLHHPPSSLQVTSGHTSRRKSIRIDGLSIDEVIARLESSMGMVP